MSLQNIQTSCSEPIYYHREYKNDLGKKTEKNPNEQSWVDTCKRVALVSLPFFSLYKPLSFPLSLAMGGLRTWTCFSQLVDSIRQGDVQGMSYQLLQTAIAVIALVGTIFAHPLGMLITTANDLVLEITNLIKSLIEGDYKKAIENCLGIINNALYLTLFLHGGLEIAIASLAMQILIGLYHSISEFKKGNNIEGIGHFLMSMIRGNQLADQAKMVQTKLEIEYSLQKIKEKESKRALEGSSSETIRVKKQTELDNKKTAFTDPAGVTFKSHDNNEHSKLLNQAKAENNQELIDVLVKYKNNPKNYSVLNYVLEIGDFDAAKILIEYRVGIHDINDGKFPLLLALNNKLTPVSIIHELLSLSYSNEKSQCLMLVANIASSKEDLDLIKLILDYGANPNDILKTAVIKFSEFPNLLELLADYNIDPNIPYRKDSTIFLSLLSHRNFSIELAVKLIDKGLSFNSLNKGLLYSIGCSRLDVAKKLIEAGADVNCVYGDRSPLDEVVSLPPNTLPNQEILDFFYYLIKNKANVNWENKRGETILYWAINGVGIGNAYPETFRLRIEMIRLLLENGADPNKKVWGKSPISLLQDQDKLTDYELRLLIEMLVQYGANPQNDTSNSSPKYKAVSL